MTHQDDISVSVSVQNFGFTRLYDYDAWRPLLELHLKVTERCGPKTGPWVTTKTKKSI